MAENIEISAKALKFKVLVSKSIKTKLYVEEVKAISNFDDGSLELVRDTFMLQLMKFITLLKLGQKTTTE